MWWCWPVAGALADLAAGTHLWAWWRCCWSCLQLPCRAGHERGELARSTSAAVRWKATCAPAGDQPPQQCPPPTHTHTHTRTPPHTSMQISHLRALPDSPVPTSAGPRARRRTGCGPRPLSTAAACAAPTARAPRMRTAILAPGTTASRTWASPWCAACMQPAPRCGR